MRPELSEAIFIDGLEPLLKNHSLLAAERWAIVSTTYPLLRIAMVHHRSNRLRVAQFHCCDWDELPPEFDLLDPGSLESLPGSRWPTGQYWFQSGWSHTQLLATPKPFLCMRGLREYHTHFQHLDDEWDNYRGKPEYSLISIVQKVGQKFQDANV